jgi:hypothetical protein
MKLFPPSTEGSLPKAQDAWTKARTGAKSRKDTSHIPYWYRLDDKIARDYILNKFEGQTNHDQQCPPDFDQSKKTEELSPSETFPGFNRDTQGSFDNISCSVLSRCKLYVSSIFSLLPSFHADLSIKIRLFILIHLMIMFVTAYLGLRIQY